MNIGLMVHILGRVTMIGVLGNKKILREPRNMPTKTLEYLKIKKKYWESAYLTTNSNIYE
jgi:hypothetical protein